MIKLTNNASSISIFVGTFSTDELESDFNSQDIITMSYSDFMAWLYQFCNIITGDYVIAFVIDPVAFNNALIAKYKATGETLEYKIMRS